MKKSIFLIDWENNSQKFIDVKKFPDYKSSDFEVIIFKRKDGLINDKTLINDKNIKIVDASTNGPEAADDRLKFYALERVISKDYYSEKYYPSTHSIFIVCGGDKGYEEIIAILKAKSFEVTLVDARNTTLIQCLPKSIICEYEKCMQVFNSTPFDYDKNDHKNNIICRSCGTKFICKQHQQDNAKLHQPKCYTPCLKLQCPYSVPCEKLLDANHLNSHPKCSDNACGCGEYFLNEQSMRDHLDPNYCRFCKFILQDRNKFVQHQRCHASELKLDKCRYCETTVIDKKKQKKS